MTTIRKAAALVLGNWLSRAYLLLVAAVAIFVFITYATWDGPDANLAGVWLIFVTLPGSYLGVGFAGVLPESALEPMIYGGMIFGAALNAALIGLLVRAARGARRGRTA